MPKVAKQKNGRYQRSVMIEKNEDGAPIRKFFTGHTFKEVDAGHREMWLVPRVLSTER